MEINIIWIDDHQDFINVQKRELKRAIPDFDIKINETKDGRNIERFLRAPIDFVLCDWNLKDKEGDLSVKLVNEARSKNKYSRIIFYSGYPLDQLKPQILLKLIKVGICRLVDKPDLINAVVDEVEKGLNIYSIIDKWLSYYGQDKKSFTFSVLGKEFRNKRVGALREEVRKGSQAGRKFTYELTKYMLSMVTANE